MVIFGKKAKALIKRVEELEKELPQSVTGIFETHDKLLNVMLKGNKTLTERIDKLETELKDLKQIIENSLENGEPKKTPQQLMREWFLGDEKEGGK